MTYSINIIDTYNRPNENDVSPRIIEIIHQARLAGAKIKNNDAHGWLFTDIVFQNEEDAALFKLTHL